MYPYLLRSHLMIVSGLLESHAAPVLGVPGLVGVVTTGAGVTKLWVSDHGPVTFESYAFTRQ